MSNSNNTSKDIPVAIIGAITAITVALISGVFVFFSNTKETDTVSKSQPCKVDAPEIIVPDRTEVNQKVTVGVDVNRLNGHAPLFIWSSDAGKIFYGENDISSAKVPYTQVQYKAPAYPTSDVITVQVSVNDSTPKAYCHFISIINSPIVSPAPLISPSTPSPPPVAIPSPPLSQASISLTPIQFVENYFQLQNAGEFEKAYSMRSGRANNSRCNKPRKYLTLADYRNEFEGKKVSYKNLRIERSLEDKPIISLDYQDHFGQDYFRLYIELTRSPTGYDYLIDQFSDEDC